MSVDASVLDRRGMLAAAYAVVGDGPLTTIPIHALLTGRCRAVAIGAAARPEALVVQTDLLPGEPFGFGDAEGIVRLLATLAGWTCVEVEPALAEPVGNAISARTGRPVRFYRDLHFVLPRAPEPHAHEAVRLFGLDDLDLLVSGDRSLACWGEVGYAAWVLTEGLVAGAAMDGTLVATAACAARTALYADIGVTTLEPYRGRGLSTAAACAVAVELRRIGLAPVWSTGADNRASQRVAAKLGFEPAGERTYVIPQRA